MSPEVLQFPEPKKIIDTPESLQECLALSEAIDTQLTDWKQFSATRHPTIVQRSLRVFIYQQCHPSDEQEAGPRALILPIIHNEKLDEYEINDDDYQTFFERVRAIINNPNVPPDLEKVVQYLHRLFVTREALADRLNPEEFAYKEPFHAVTYRMIEELF